MTDKQIKQVEEAMLSIITDVNQCMEFRSNAVHALSEFEDTMVSCVDWATDYEQNLLDE